MAARKIAFPSLDVVHLTEEFEERVSVMKSVPRFLRGLRRIAKRGRSPSSQECGCTDHPEAG